MAIRKHYRELLYKRIEYSPTSHNICNDKRIWSAPAAGAKASNLRLYQREEIMKAVKYVQDEEHYSEDGKTV